ncbi:hypothetical protein E2651_01065 [Streptomyces sp. MZ04]|nr:hypothetical protein E2651_01065 [Streptomyces sp. MZ04]
MSTEVSGTIECRPGVRLWGPDDKDSAWHAAIDLWLLNIGNAYDALACLFGVRNTYGFRHPAARTRRSTWCRTRRSWRSRRVRRSIRRMHRGPSRAFSMAERANYGARSHLLRSGPRVGRVRIFGGMQERPPHTGWRGTAAQRHVHVPPTDTVAAGVLAQWAAATPVPRWTPRTWIWPAPICPAPTSGL